jgi:hypothetical protein
MVTIERRCIRLETIEPLDIRRADSLAVRQALYHGAIYAGNMPGRRAEHDDDGRRAHWRATRGTQIGRGRTKTGRARLMNPATPLRSS